MKFTLLTFFFHCVYGMSSEPKFTLKKKRYTFIPTLVPVVEKTILLLLNCVGTFVENHLEKKKRKKKSFGRICMRLFWTFHFIPFSFLLIPHLLHD